VFVSFLPGESQSEGGEQKAGEGNEGGDQPQEPSGDTQEVWACVFTTCGLALATFFINT